MQPSASTAAVHRIRHVCRPRYAPRRPWHFPTEALTHAYSLETVDCHAQPHNRLPLNGRCPGCEWHPGQRQSQHNQRGGLKMLAGQILAVIRFPGEALSARSVLTSSMRALTSADEMLFSLAP